MRQQRIDQSRFFTSVSDKPLPAAKTWKTNLGQSHVWRQVKVKDAFTDLYTILDTKLSSPSLSFGDDSLRLPAVEQKVSRARP